MILFMLPMTADGFLQLLHPMKAKWQAGSQRGFCLAWPLTACSFISTELCDGSRVDRKAVYRGQWGCRESHGTVFVIRIPEG